MKNSLILLLITVLLGSCNKEPNSNSKDTPTFIKWEVVLPQDDDFITIYDPIVHEDLVLIPVDDQGVLIAYNKTTGEEVWRWTDASTAYEGADGFGRWSYIHDDILVTGQRNIFYGIDIKTGNTLWHQNFDLQASGNLFGFDDKVATVFSIADELVSFELIDVYTGQSQQILKFEREDEYDVSGHIPKLYEKDNILYLCFVRAKWLSSVDGYEEYGWLYNYNITNGELEWVTDTIPKNSHLLSVPGFLPRVEGGKILIESNSIQAYNIETGQLDWIDNSHTNTFAWNTHLTAADGKVFGNNENGYMIALDVDTGEELWRTDTGGTGSRIEYYDEKVYINEITRSGASYLMILDANTGEILHDIPSPYEIFGENHWYWDDVITVDQETGLIYTADHNKVMCLELED